MAREIEKQLKTKEINSLYKVLTDIDNIEDMGRFLRDLLTLEEIQEASRRLKAAQMLSEGETFRAIAQETQMSSTTIARINYWLHHGTGGYRKALEKLT